MSADRAGRNGGGVSWSAGSVHVFSNGQVGQGRRRVVPALAWGAGPLSSNRERNPAPIWSYENLPGCSSLSGRRSWIDLAPLSPKGHPLFLSPSRDVETRPTCVRVIGLAATNKAPLNAQHRVGKGKIITCLTGCAARPWTQLAEIPDAFVPIQWRSQRKWRRATRS